MSEQGQGSEMESLVEAALRVLNTADPFEKAKLGDSVASKWLEGAISQPFNPSLDFPVPDRPARLTNVKLVSPGLMPKLGKAGSLQSRQAIVHSLVHIESWAIDLSWDIIARFGKQERMPKEFFTDFVKVAQDEGRHFTLLAKRLEELGSSYGALQAHDGLWDSAMATSNDLLARLAIEHCVHEARGLDVLPTTISRFRNGGDDETADLLERVVYPEEITHCAAGIRWFKYLCFRSRDPTIEAHDLTSQETGEGEDGLTMKEEEDEEVIQKFHVVVRTHFRGPLKPPFNEKARKAAGFGPRWTSSYQRCLLPNCHSRFDSLGKISVEMIFVANTWQCCSCLGENVDFWIIYLLCNFQNYNHTLHIFLNNLRLSQVSANSENF